MSVLDVVLLVVLLAYAVSGFRQGLVVGVLSVGSFLLGAVAGMSLLPDLVTALALVVGCLTLWRLVTLTRTGEPFSAVGVRQVRILSLVVLGYAVLATRLSSAIRRPRVRRWMNRAGGGAIMGAGLATALARR